MTWTDDLLGLPEGLSVVCAQAEEISSFLLPMLEYDPARRATARQMLTHPWLRPSSCGAPSHTPRDSPFALKRLQSEYSDLDSVGHDSWIDEHDERETKCPRY